MAEIHYRLTPNGHAHGFFGYELYVRPGDIVDIELDTLADMTKPIIKDIPNPVIRTQSGSF